MRYKRAQFFVRNNKSFLWLSILLNICKLFIKYKPRLRQFNMSQRQNGSTMYIVPCVFIYIYPCSMYIVHTITTNLMTYFVY